MKNEIAVVMAAGMGTRLLPLTDKIAKPLIKVNGVPMIETLINALNSRGSMTIYVVVGYKKEQFDYLTSEYSNVVLIENEEFSFKNNISSLKAVENVLGESNCFLCEADLYIEDYSIFHHEFDRSCYFGKYVEGATDDWGFDLENDRIIKIKKGGNDQYNMCGVSYWLKDDILKLKNAITEAYNDSGHVDLFWDEVANNILEDINLGVYHIKNDDIMEIDTYSELKSLDKTYK